MNTKEEITNILMSIQRDGMGRMVDFLETSDFFTAPASTKYHLAYSGGLAEHSLSVFKTLIEMNILDRFVQESIVPAAKRRT